MLLAFVSDPLRRSIRNAHAQSGKAGLQLTFRAVPPGHSLPFGLGQHVFGGHRQVIRDRPLTRAATAGNRPDELHTHGVDLEVTASTQPKRTPAAMTRSISARAIFGFVRATRCSAGTPARAKRSGSLTQLSGRKSRNATVTGTSPRASVSDTNVWQLAFLPKADAYCEATPTECLPFFGIAVSSITSTASLPPISPSAWIRSSFSSGVASQTPAAIKWCS